MPWEDEYARAIDKVDSGQEESDMQLGNASFIVAEVPEPYKARLVKWLDRQSRDDFMVHGGTWEDLMATIFNLHDEE